MSLPAVGSQRQATGPRFADLQPLLDPASAVLIGVSERTDPAIITSAAGKGIPVYGVHPRTPAVSGLEMAARVDQLPIVPELAFVLVGHRHLLPAVQDAINAGVRAFVIPGLGNEAGAEALPVTHALGHILQKGGAVAAGPNGMGVATPDRPSFWIGSVPNTFVDGHVSVVVHSGSIGEALLAIGPRVGFRTVVSPGGEIAGDTADYCAFFARDERTRALGLCIETVRRWDAFEAALDQLARANKPVVCLKLGRSPGGAGAVTAHNGADAGSDAAFTDMLRAHGVIQVDDYPLFLEVLEVLGRRRRPAGTRIGGISNSGGEAALLADHADAAGIPFAPLSAPVVERLKQAFPLYQSPQNPVDMWGVDLPDRAFSETLDILARSGDYDMLITQVDQSQFLGATESENALRAARALADAVDEADLFGAVTSVQPGDPSAAVFELARARDIALLRGSENAMRALAAVATWRPRTGGNHHE